MRTDNLIIVGDALDQLKKMGSESAYCCITSPPYYNLRNYGVSGQIGVEEPKGVHREVDRGIPRGQAGATSGWHPLVKHRRYLRNRHQGGEKTIQESGRRG